MKIYNTQAEIDADIVDGVLQYDGDIEITFDCVVGGDIDAGNIDALDIKANNIKANNIKANNIKAKNIKANNIVYFAFCIAYNSLKCRSIKGTRVNSIHTCLDKNIEFKGKTNDDQ